MKITKTVFSASLIAFALCAASFYANSASASRHGKEASQSIQPACSGNCAHTQTIPTNTCCAPGATCCTVGANCCTTESGCCAMGAGCCAPGSSCCK